jgi:hypothetical protein
LFWALVLVVGLGLTLTYLWFLWYRTDSDARGFQRSAWLSVGVVVFPPGAELAGMAIHAGLRQRPQKSTVADIVNVRGAPSTR